jgi:asparagine synthase (glutamine-hydrolysing)
VFCSNFSSLPLVDRIRSEGPGRGAWETLKALEEITGATSLAIGGQALRTLCFGRRPDWRPGLAGFLGRDLGTSEPDPFGADPQRPPRRELPGKVYHAEMIARVLPYVEGFDRADAPALLSPLLAQPVVETCLGIPSWHWSASGQTRSVARMAFRDALPPWIVNRRSKGGPDAFARDLALSRVAQLREIILDGELLRRGLLDRRRIEAALETASLFRYGHHSLLLHIADTEAWLRHWSGRGAASSPALSLAGSLSSA